MGAISPVRIKARYYRRDGNAYVCELCPHGCRIPIGQVGRCGARRAEEDYLVAYSYGRYRRCASTP